MLNIRPTSQRLGLRLCCSSMSTSRCCPRFGWEAVLQLYVNQQMLPKVWLRSCAAALYQPADVAKGLAEKLCCSSISTCRCSPRFGRRVDTIYSVVWLRSCASRSTYIYIYTHINQHICLIIFINIKKVLCTKPTSLFNLRYEWIAIFPGYKNNNNISET